MGAMDPREKKSLVEDVIENKKCCSDCKTTKTPLWRGGPAGPKSLCNACGIRYRKRRRAMAGLSKGPDKKKEKSQSTAIATTTTATAKSTTNLAKSAAADDDKPTTGQGNGLSGSLKIKLVALGSQVLLQRSPSPSIVKKQRCQRRRKFGEEEQQAAFSLMAMSCGTVFA